MSVCQIKVACIIMKILNHIIKYKFHKCISIGNEDNIFNLIEQNVRE